jgi:hypothetical protein
MLVTSACANQSSSPAIPPLPSDCFGAPGGVATLDEPFDPHGQGRELLGVGLLRRNVLVRIDRFDLQTIADRNGQRIKDVHIHTLSHVLQGTIDKGVLRREPADWSGATVVGQAHCLGGGHQLAAIKLTIRALAPRRIGANVQTYDLEVEDRGEMVDACLDSDDLAVAVNGYWDETGAHVIDGRSFSFACTKRDVVTCLDEGYVDDPGDPTRYALFKACTRMLRADYCGNGESHTRTGTFVTIYDNKRIAEDRHLDPLAFEAAWNADGAVCMARPRWPDDRPACSRPIQVCASSVARELDEPASVPLLFNESCLDHPCEVKRTEFSAASPGGAPRGT